jgi:hypothetical protein
VTDLVPTAAGDLRISFIGHGTLLFAWAGRVVHVDPWGRFADCAALPAGSGIEVRIRDLR